MEYSLREAQQHQFGVLYGHKWATLNLLSCVILPLATKTAGSQIIEVSVIVVLRCLNDFLSSIPTAISQRKKTKKSAFHSGL